MIRAQGLIKDFGPVRAVDGLSFEVEPGEIYGLLGPNGAGKTTAMRLLSALLPPTGGSAVVAGYGVESEPREVRARIGILTEVPGLYLRLTPSEYLDFFAQVHGIRASASRSARVEEMLRLVGLWDRRDSVMRTFSKGMQQRVAIARTLVQDPPVLLLDEPTAALDPEAARSVRDYVRDLADGRGRTILLCTHNLFEAEQLCQRLSIVRAGRQVAEGTPAALKGRLATTCVLRVRECSSRLVDGLRAIAGIESVVEDGPGTVTFLTRDPQWVNPYVIRHAVAAGVDVIGLAEASNTLEDVYLAIMAAPGDGAYQQEARVDATLTEVSAPPALRTAAMAPGSAEAPKPRTTRGTGAVAAGAKGAGLWAGVAMGWVIALRELREALRDPNLVLPLLLMPCFIGLLTGVTAFVSFGSNTSGAVGTAVTNAALDQLPSAAVEHLSNVPTTNRNATIELLIKAFSIPLFWVIPVALTPALAADSFVGERERASLEPLLATPIGTGQLLLGKLVASVIPATVGTWLGVLVFWAMTLLSGSPLYPRLLLADSDWVFSLVVVAPLVALFTASVAALISTRVTGYRVAYQLNGLVALPVVLLLIPATAFLFLITGAALAYIAVLIALVDIAVIAWSRRLFTRERLLSRR
jgi:ABC-2 type transport system ATP-binding protein